MKLFNFCFSEFAKVSWLSLGLFLILLIFILTIIYYVLTKTGIEDENADNFISSISLATELSLKTNIQDAPDSKMKSFTYKMSLLVVLFYGFIVFSYYEAYLAMTLILENNNSPFENWEDVDKSDKNLLVWKGASSEAKFKDALPGSVLRKIYDEKITIVPEDKILNKVHASGSLAQIQNDESVVFSTLSSYQRFEEYPCKITSPKSMTLK